MKKIKEINPDFKEDVIGGLIEQIATPDDAADVTHFIQVQYSQELDNLKSQSDNNRRFKRPSWRVVFDDAKKNKIDEFAKVSYLM